MEPNSEHVFFQDSEVTVTSGRFSVGQKMYPVRNLTSVEATEDHAPANRSGAMLFIAFALGTLCLVPKSETPERVLLVFTLPLVVVAVFLWRRAKPTSRWRISIHTAGVQTQALETSNKARRDAIVAALHQAVSSR